ncbi:MAG: TauD/TfdA family dioxygenase [Chromatiales bacterium]|nr:TauD/TfdA family dioxygenase [Chromatiales bacterium]
MVLAPVAASFGREVQGVDLARAVPRGIRARLSLAVAEHQVLVFRNQTLDARRAREIASWFGSVRDVPGTRFDRQPVRGVRTISNIDVSGRVRATHPDPFSRIWHADGAWMNPPARASALYAQQVPSSGGETVFADMYAATEALHDDRRASIQRLRVIHHVDLARVFRFGRSVVVPSGLPLAVRLRRWRRFLRAMLPGGASVHPVVRVCADTGRAAVVLGADAWRVLGMSRRRGMLFVEQLTSELVGLAPLYTHRWGSGDLVIWDNRSTLHRVLDYNPLDRRVMLHLVMLEPSHA